MDHSGAVTINVTAHACANAADVCVLDRCWEQRGVLGGRDLLVRRRPVHHPRGQLRVAHRRRGVGEVTMEARSSTTGAVLCTAREELAVASYIGHPVPTLGVRTLGCDVPSSVTSVIVELEVHAWAAVGGAAGGSSHAEIQIVEFGIESCTASCSGHCGGSAWHADSGTCYCDDLCSSYGDCCADVAEACITDSCWEQCGGASAGGTCWCDSLCTTYGDCCDDFADSCE